MNSVPLLWLYGADAVGKSTVAWEIYERLGERRVGTAFVDTDYLGFCSSAESGDPSTLVAANLEAMWPNFVAAGAQCLIVAGVVVTVQERTRFTAAVPGARLTLVRLRARPETQRQRILRRARAEGLETGGAVTGHTVDRVDEYAERAAGFARMLDENDIADFTVDTDEVPVPDVATSILARLPVGWPAFEE